MAAIKTPAQICRKTQLHFDKQKNQATAWFLFKLLVSMVHLLPLKSLVKTHL